MNIPLLNELLRELNCEVTFSRCHEYGCRDEGATIMPNDWRCPACALYDYLTDSGKYAKL